MLYAHVTDGVVDEVAPAPPSKAWDEAALRFRNLENRDPAAMALCGWYVVYETPKPPDTQTETHDAQYAYEDGALFVAQNWVVRAKTPEELAADTVETNHAALLAKAVAALEYNRDSLVTLQNALNPLNTISGATFSTVAQRDAAIKSLADQCILLVQHSIRLTRENSALIRLVAQRLDSQEGT